ncbi:MFS transporter [Nocardia canadensis]|uniref:MFS transporter n=1 Tax=Nocardia canadensis TaxID=3065238 RepID=UPI00292F7BF8|nr:MFS transporter [Nocardia canadensis]
MQPDEPAPVQRLSRVQDGPATAMIDAPSVTKRSDLAPVGRGFITRLVLAIVGTGVAYIAAMAYSLALRVDQLAPGHEEYLGYLTALGGVLSIALQPILGVFSDRTRSRFGRRRPYLAGGALVGTLGLLILATAPDMAVLTVGWLVTVLGWSMAAQTATGSLQADLVPEEQRGRIAGLAGFATLVAPALGVGIASLGTGNSMALLLGPGLIGALLVLPLVLMGNEDKPAAEPPEPMPLRALFAKLLFDPRRFPDFSWNWLGRFLFFVGLTFNTTFTTFLFAQRLGKTVSEVGALVTMVAGAGIIATTIGALGGGFLSDRLRRRRVLVLIAGCVFALGAVVMALSGGMAGLIVGAALSNLGMGAFSAVDQAVLLDVLPDRREAGRFLGIMNYATQIPHGIAPLAASVLLALGASGEKNYTALYLAGGVCTVLGGAVIHLRVKGSR